MRLALLLAVLAGPALAQTPLGVPIGGDEFEALVEGRTLTYGEGGREPYGIEHYFEGRAVAWAWMGSDECQRGTWYEEPTAQGPSICFVYDGDPDPKCWLFFLEGEALRAVYLGDGGATVLYELVDEPGGLVCGGVGA